MRSSSDTRALSATQTSSDSQALSDTQASGDSKASGDTQLAGQLLRLINGSWISQACYVMARLGVPDLLASGPRSAEALAAKTGAHAQSLRRLLNALCSVDLCVQRDDGTFELTQLGALLRSDHPSSVNSWALHWGGNSWLAWANLLHCVRTGRSARELIEGTPGFTHLDSNPEAAAIFNRAMVQLTRLAALEVVKAYDFAGRKVMDVGGGYGELLAQALIAYPTATGVLFDMAHAIGKARDAFVERGLADRCEFVAGDFFDSVPPGADVYMLKSVIHDWADDQAITILRACRRAMHANAKLLLVERMMPERLNASAQSESLARSDLHMLVALGAQERSPAEFEKLLRAADLRTVRLIDTGGDYQLIEAMPIDSQRLPNVPT
jgi:ubiquinone/menaquinone biosynthesis C-methylase UbiE